LVLGILHHADHFVTSTRALREALAHGVPGEAPGEGLVDDRHRRRLRRVAFLEVAASQQRGPEGAEVLAADAVRERVAVPACVWRMSGHVEAAPRDPAADRSDVRL